MPGPIAPNRPNTRIHMRITIDTDRCTGHGLCYAQAPILVEPDDRGYGQVVQADVAPEHEAAARRAEGNCPERAVILSDR